MFEFITNPEERGQVGIGTLIVFIAMVLVAAIAAGVLINTAGFLQTQAEETGQDSTDLVSERIDVSSEVGIVAGTENTLSEIRLEVTGAPGADQIDLAETTIQAVGPGGQENLVFTSTASNANELTQLSVPEISGGSGSFTITVNYNNIDSLTSGESNQKLIVEYDEGGDGNVEDTVEVTGSGLDSTSISATSGGTNGLAASGSFSEDDEITVDLVDTSDGDSTFLEESVTQVVGPTGTAESTILDGGNSIANLGANQFAVGSDGNFRSSAVLSDEDDFTILINPGAGAFDDSGAFGEGESATLDIVSPAGATTQVELRAPDLFNTNGEAVRL